jgi:hypothetical protein
VLLVDSPVPMSATFALYGFAKLFDGAALKITVEWAKGGTQLQSASGGTKCAHWKDGAT